MGSNKCPSLALYNVVTGMANIKMITKDAVKVFNVLGKLFIVEVTDINTWHSKTYATSYPYEAYADQYSLYIIRPLLTKMLEKISRAKWHKSMVRRDWRHRCGARPRYLSITLVALVDTSFHDYYAVILRGGTSWRAGIVVRNYTIKFISDGCWDFADVMSIIKGMADGSIIKGAGTFPENLSEPF
jgi:hypothetical protein